MLTCNTDKCSNVKLNFVVVDVKIKPVLGLQALKQLQQMKLMDEINLYSKLNVINISTRMF